MGCHFRLQIDALIHNICFSLSDLIHSVEQALGSSTSLKPTQIHSFFMAESYGIAYMQHIFIHSSLSGRLGCCHVLTVVNSAAVDPGARVSFSVMVFSGYMPRSGISGSYSRFIPSF